MLCCFVVALFFYRNKTKLIGMIIRLLLRLLLLLQLRVRMNTHIPPRSLRPLTAAPLLGLEVEVRGVLCVCGSCCWCWCRGGV